MVLDGRVSAVVPAWMLGDGEYVGLGVGDRVRTGFALAVTSTQPGGAARLDQAADRPGLTTVGGRTDAAGGTTILRCDVWVFVLLASGRVTPDAELSAEGWLTVEPYLWAAGGVLADAVPEGVADWTVARVRQVDDAARDLDRLPRAAAADPDAAYVLDLAGRG
ncbi:hypothetical protein WCD74_15390 [Actinomycetospora sp. OC33-EN08]|uniref:Uncharacterized protein n=1 Tax=Actinomycetospora aurantiaca TaxID=3129233 RepID=A0ABU8MPS2_9PSEU